jgi:hypothetical protein
MKNSFVHKLLSVSFILFILLILSHFSSAAQIQLVWDPGTEPDLAGYKVYYGTEPGAYGTPIRIGKDASYRLSDLIKGNRYYINVTAYDTYDNESDLDPLNEVSGPAIDPPGAVIQVSPSETGTDTRPTYIWNAVPDASWYYLYVDDSTGNRIQQWYPAKDLGCPDGTGTCSVTPSLDVVGSCQWWVQSSNSAGYGPWSSAMSFTVSPPLAATPGSPSGQTTDTTPTYSWNAVPGAIRYQLYVNDSVGNRIQQWYPAADLGCPDGTGTCSVTPTLDVVGSCQWWIQTYNRAGIGPWSSSGSFTAPNPTAPGAATPDSPFGETTDTTPTYTWSAAPEATWYQLYVNDSTDNRIQQWYPAADLGCPDGSGTCSVRPPIELILGPCQWWIQTYNRAGFGPWSIEKSFTIPLPPVPAAVTQIWPSGTLTDATPMYMWNAAPEATWYQLYVNDSTGNKIQKWITASEASCGTGTGTCSVKLPTALVGGTGQWWVQTYNSGGFGPWSLPGRNFTISPPS